MAATYFGLKESSKRAGRTNFLGLAEIEKAETRTVAGTMYYIQVKAGESSCKVAEEANWTPEGCGATDPANAKSCTMRVVHRAWQTAAPYELMGGTCKEL
ncbi:hypothetical protein GR130_23910 [Streptomyces sp. GS7]|nr:hypothetical protein GR130_23910 [Streptomyces sp. GS7]